MSLEGDDLPDPPPRLANPYLAAPGRPAVRGVTLGRSGVVAAGVLVVALPVGVPAVADGAGAGRDGSVQIALGAAADVDADVQAMCMPGGYLWPGETTWDDPPPGSPALA